MRKIAIQGIAGSYHEIAARNHFGSESIEISYLDSFREVVDTVKENPEISGLLAIENTIAGSLLQNHELIRRSGLRICGEYKLRISHNLAALPGTRLEDIKEVHSHPMAILQCSDFLDSIPLAKRNSAGDTAMSARRVASESLHGHAAICSREAAESYGLEILARGIESDPHNYTRFLHIAVPGRDEVSETEINKASLVFSLPHTSGTLARVLSELARFEMNLSKIQSFPMLGLEWQYLFYVDFTFTRPVSYRQALAAITPLCPELRVLGEYRA